VKVAIFNPQMGRFMDDVVGCLASDYGYEVKVDRYYDPEKALWADVMIFFTTDNNIKSATDPGNAILADDSNFFPWDLHDMDLTGKKVIVMPVDIEVWLGHQHGVKWDVVTDVVFMAPHIKDLMIDVLPESVKVHMLPFAVDTDRYNFVDKPVGKKIAWVCEKWPTKGIDYMLQIMAELPRDYELHTIGGWNDRAPWEKAYQEDFIARHDIKFYDYEWVEDQNEWLADKDFILSCSKKEAFGASIAEGMSKGLIPVVHNFYGASAIWPGLTWETIAGAVDYLTMHYTPNARKMYRDYLFEKGYDMSSYVVKLDKIMRGEE
jgi:glycosyltransferase involved in cell wall biosynthesis